MDQSRSKPKLHDPLIANRVRKYLEDNIDKRYVNIPEMIKHLQAKYPEYARKKQQPFKHLVHQAYQIVSQELMGPQVSSDDSEQSDLEVMADSSVTNANIMNNMMSSLYNKQPSAIVTRPQSTSAPSVAIDISSDESCDETPTNGDTRDKRDETFGEAISSVSKPASVNSSEASCGSTDAESKGPKRGSDIADSTESLMKAKKRKVTNTPDGEKMTTQLQIPSTIGATSISSIPVISNVPNVPVTITCTPAANNNGRSSGRLPGISTIRNTATDENSAPTSVLTTKKKYKKTITIRKSNETFRDIGGMESALKELCEILMHVKAPEPYFALGLMPPRGILLHGPSGCGKTLLARAIAGQLELPLCEIPATELIAGVSGESEQRIRDIFEQVTSISPCILFLDEIDAISSNRSTAQREMERRIVSQLISSMDELKRSAGGQAVLIVGATTRPDVLDPALRRVGRFDHEIAIGVPNRKDRKQILEIICDGLCVEDKCDFDTIATLTPGFVGADLLALISRAAVIAVKRICAEQLHDFQSKALTIVDLDGEDTMCDETGDDEAADQESIKSSDGTDESQAAAKETKEEDKKKDEEQEKDKEKEENEDQDKEKGKEQEKQPAKGKETEKAESVIKSTETVENMETEASETPEDKSAAESANKKDDKEANGQESSTTPLSQPLAKSVPKNGEVAASKPANAIAKHDPTLCEMMNLLDNPLDLSQHLDYFCITYEDMKQAVKLIQPSAKREGFITIPDTAWDDVGSLHDIREELQMAVLAPVKYPDMLERLGLTAPSGVLLCGPPGCGKTLLAKAIANEAGINFIAVKGPELMNMYVGESERAVRACFQRARNSAPCVIFFDEFDSLCPKRSEGNDSGSGTRIVNQLLTEMDGVEDRKGVYVLAATNRPDIIDPAILRPGRLDTILYVGLPKEADRIEILTATTKNRTRPVLADDVDFKEIAAKTDGYTGADLNGLVKQASMLALKDALKNPQPNSELCVRNKHFDEAIKVFRPSVNPQSRAAYEKLRQKYAAPRGEKEE